MRRIISAISVLALAFSLVASATSANAAVAGYDSAYAGESAFLNLAPGQSGTFTVFFANTGSTSWVRGSASQVDLAACLENKTTCNAQDASEAPFNSGWLSATRYATHTQTTVSPGQIGTFTYNVTVPAAQAAGTYRFNGALVLSSTGADIHNEGYYQDVTVAGTTTPAGAAAITSLNPSTGSVNGGTTVVISGSGFVCTPAFPAVNFGSGTATVTSCGATTLTVTSPAGAAGSANVTVTNTGAAASNPLTFTYSDTTRPTFDSVSVAGNVATVTFSEAVCRIAAYDAADWTVTVNGIEGTFEETSDNFVTCDAEFDNGSTTGTLILGATPPPGSFVAVTLVNGGDFRDTAGNLARSPRTNTTTAASAETTAPTITSVTGVVGTSTITIKFSEPVYCTGLTFDSSDIELTDFNGATTDPTATAAGANACGASAGTADTSFSVTLSSPLTAGKTYTVTLTPEANEIQDVSGNDLASPSAVSFTTSAADTSAPTLTDTRATANVITTNFSDVGDKFTITFSEEMSTTTAGDTISLQDADGTSGSLTCGTNATCTFDTAGTTITVTLTGAPTGVTETATSTPGIQLPVTITALGGFADLQTNVPNLSGSADRVIDLE